MPSLLHSLEAKDLILKETLKYIPTEGWTLSALAKGVFDAGYEKGTEYGVFQGNSQVLLAYYFDFLDRQMVQELDKINLDAMRVRDRIATAIWVRLKLLEPHRQVVKITLSYLAHPTRALEGAQYLFQTLDHIWHKAGDRSTDFNYYTKRAILAGVYLSTLKKWVHDSSFESMETRAFLNRRLENALMVPRFKATLRTAFGFLQRSFSSDPFSKKDY